ACCVAADGRGVSARAALLSGFSVLGPRTSGDGRGVHGVHRAVRDGGVPRPRRDVEGPCPGENGRVVTDASAFASGKGHQDENFPVASWLVRRQARAPILAFYRFVRAADDVADQDRKSTRLNSS